MSCVVAGSSTVLVLGIGAPAAYSLHRFRWPNWLLLTVLGWLLLFYMIPVMTLVGPWYLIFRELGLYNTRTALILTHVTINLPMTIWLLLTFSARFRKSWKRRRRSTAAAGPRLSGWSPCRWSFRA